MFVRNAASFCALMMVMALPITTLMAAPESKKSPPGAPKKTAAPSKSVKPPVVETKPAKPGNSQTTPNTSPTKPTVIPSKQPPPTASPAQRNAAVLKSIETREKSELAGAVFKKFLEAKTADERLALVADAARHTADIQKYFESSPNRKFTPLTVQILGSVTSPSNPNVTLFPYFVATDKNKLGFVTVVIETRDGFKVDWPTFALGHDQSLEEFLTAKKAGDTKTFLVGIAKTHIFGDAPPGGEAKWAAYAIEMPMPREDLDPEKVFAEKESPVGRQLASRLGWAKGHLCRLTILVDGGNMPFLRATGYEPYAK